jgi:hypothetical protein
MACSTQTWFAGIRRVKGARRLGMRLGNWLTAAQGKSLLAVPAGNSVRDKRDHVILALLLGCGCDERTDRPDAWTSSTA